MFVDAAIALDACSISWKAAFTPNQALDFAAGRHVRCTNRLYSVLYRITSIMENKYCIIEIGRENSRVIYVKWSPSMIKVSLDAFDSMRQESDEFDITVENDWATLRMWWD